MFTMGNQTSKHCQADCSSAVCLSSALHIQQSTPEVDTNDALHFPAACCWGNQSTRTRQSSATRRTTLPGCSAARRAALHALEPLPHVGQRHTLYPPLTCSHAAWASTALPHTPWLLPHAGQPLHALDLLPRFLGLYRTTTHAWASTAPRATPYAAHTLELLPRCRLP